MGSSPQTLLTIVSSLSSLLNIGCQIVLIVVIMGAVRRHRPDAASSLVAWAIGALVFSVLSPLLYFAMSLLVSRSGGIDALVMGQAAMAVFAGIVHVGLVILLARGLVRIAQPPKPVVVDSGAAYR